MISARSLAISISWVVLSAAPWIYAQDVEPSEARMIHQRPAVIQELEWWPQNALGSSAQADPVKNVLFSFYNGELFRILVIWQGLGKMHNIKVENGYTTIIVKAGEDLEQRAKDTKEKFASK